MTPTNEMNKERATTQRRLLASVSALALGAALGSSIMAGARAAETSLNYANLSPLALAEGVATGYSTKALNQDNVVPVTAIISAAEVGIVKNADPDDPEGAANTDHTTANVIQASATGNRIMLPIDEGDGTVLPTVDLSLLTDNPDGNDTMEGIAVIGRSVNGPDAEIRSAVSDSSLFGISVDEETGAQSVSANTIRADTALNDSTLRVNGEVPATYDGAGIGGAISFDSDADPTLDEAVLDADGTVALSNVQLNTQVGPNAGDGSIPDGSRATVTGNAVSLSNTPTTAGQTVGADSEVDHNEIAARYVGNDADTTVAAEGSAFDGSVALSNVQANLDGGTGAPAAVNDGSSVTAAIGNLEPSDPSDTEGSTLAGALSLSGNVISSEATGNRAGVGALSDGAVDFGNEITLASGLNFSGTGADGVPNGTVTFDEGSVDADVDAGLTLLNSQSNRDTEHSSETTDATISAEVQSLAGGKIEVTDNRVEASATGNIAASRILAPGQGGSTTSVDGSAALVNVQANQGSPVAATTGGEDGVEISATVGNASATTAGSVVTDADVSIAANTVSASATGNRGSNVVALGATTLSLDGGLAGISGGHTEDDTTGGIEDVTLEVAGGATIISVQGSYGSGSSVAAENGGTSIAIDATDLDGTDIARSTLEATGNTIGAAAEANRVANTLLLEGTTISGGGAGLGNFQTSDGGDVSASVTGASVSIDAGSGGPEVDLTESTLALTDNVVSAVASANTATNGLTIDATNITVPNDGGAGDPASTVDINLAGEEGFIFEDADLDAPEVNAAFALFNDQGSSEDVSAEVSASGPSFSIEASDLLGGTGDDVSGNAVHNDRNRVTADAYASLSSNDLSIDADSALDVQDLVDPAGPGYAPVGNVTNVQTRADGAAVSATVSSGVDGVGTVFSTEVANDADNQTMTVSNNTVEARARGNVAASNSLTVTGNSIVAIPEADDALAGLTVSGNLTDGTLQADLAFTVQNAQSGGTGEVTATQEGTGAELVVNEEVAGSALIMAENAFRADAYDNIASNSLSLGASEDDTTAEITTLAASGGVQNFQVSNADTSATLGQEGTEPTPAAAYPDAGGSGTLTAGEYSFDGVTLELDPGSSFEIDLSSVTDPDERQALEDYLKDLEFEVSGDTATYSLTDPLDLSGFRDTATSTDTETGITTLTFTGFSVPEDPGIQASPSVIVSVGDDIVDSNIAVWDTKTIATAISNTATNKLAVAANTVASGIGATEIGATIDPGNLSTGTGDTVAAAFDYAVSNAQILGGSANAEANVELGIDTDTDETSISGSALSVEDNTQQAVAKGNEARNSLSLDANNYASNAPTAGVVSAQAADLAGDQNLSVDGDAWMRVSAPGSMGDSDTRSSSLSLSGNSNTALATVNHVTNDVSVSGTNLASATGVAAQAEINEAGAADYSLLTADADVVASNAQLSQTDASSEATTFVSGRSSGVGSDNSAGLDGSSVALNDNATESWATGNQARTTVSIGGEANLVATGALLSSQLGSGDVTANTDAEIGYALNDEISADVTESAIDLSGNRAWAVATANGVENALKVSGTNIDHLGDSETDAGVSVTGDNGASYASEDNVFGASADHVLNNGQWASGDVRSDARMVLTIDLSDAASSPEAEAAFLNSAADLHGNQTIAESTANRASNTLTLDAGANLAATGGVLNAQYSVGSVSATANTWAAFAVGENVETPLDAAVGGSSVNLTGNQTTASARGNVALNALTATAGAGYGTPTLGATSGSVDGAVPISASADYAVLNNQVNESGISAQVGGELGGTVYGVALNGTVAGASLAVANNSVAAMASGNSAVNRVTLGALAGGSPSAAVTSSQYNGGEVTASVAGVSIGIGAGAAGHGVAGGSLGVGGNQITASAVGNSVASSIGAGQ